MLRTFFRSFCSLLLVVILPSETINPLLAVETRTMRSMPAAPLDFRGSADPQFGRLEAKLAGTADRASSASLSVSIDNSAGHNRSHSADNFPSVERDRAVISTSHRQMRLTRSAALGIDNSSKQHAFVENMGQFDGRVKYQLKRGGATLWLTNAGIVFDLLRSKRLNAGSPIAGLSDQDVKRQRPARDSDFHGLTPESSNMERVVFYEDFIGANEHPSIQAQEPEPGIRNYFQGNDPDNWCTNVRAYSQVTYKDVWPHIDLRFYSKGQLLEQEFIVRPGGHPSQIQIAYREIEGLEGVQNGSLRIRTAFGDLSESQPRIFQEIRGKRVAVSGRFKLKTATSYTFEVGPHRSEYPLILDPSLSYSTYVGGSGEDIGQGIAVDSAGNVYITGETSSTDFPTANAFKATNPSVGSYHAFVAKLNATGNALVYSTYLGGSGNESSYAIAVDSTGNAYVTGQTTSTNFPTAQPIQPALHGNDDAFVAKLNANGNALVYSTYLGGTGDDLGTGIAVDSSGNAYVAGTTSSGDFPTLNPLQATFASQFNGPGCSFGFGNFSCFGADGFVTKLNATGSAFVYSTYLGGQHDDRATGIAVDATGSAYVTGTSNSTDFPTTSGAFMPAPGVGTQGHLTYEAFISKLTPNGRTLAYSTYLGDNGDVIGSAIAVDGAGNAYLTGETRDDGGTLPLSNALQASSGGGRYKAFVTEVNTAGSALVYSTYLGGSGYEFGLGIAVDSFGNAYVTGFTNSTNFPTANPIQSTFGGGAGSISSAQILPPALPFNDAVSPTGDTFVAKLIASGSALVYSTYLGGSGDDVGRAIAVDSAGNAYVTGNTNSANFPTAGALQAAFAGGVAYGDAFVAKIPSSARITPNAGGDSGTVTVTIFGQGFQPGATLTLVGAGLPTIVCSPVTVSPDGQTATATCDLSGQALGARDVVVTNPDGTKLILSGAFSIEKSRGGQVWVDIVGRSTIRPGQPQTFFITYGNNGDVDAYFVTLWFSFPLFLSWQLTKGTATSTEVQVGNDVLLSFDVITIPPGTGFIPIVLTAPLSTGQQSVRFQLSTWVLPGQ